MIIKTKGFSQLQKKLERLGKTQARAGMRAGMRAGVRVLRNAIRVQVNVDKGWLRRAQDSKVTNKGDNFTGIVGANVAKLLADNRIDNDRPTNIDHLVNFGHVAPDGTFIRPSGYMERGANAGMPAAEARVIAKITEYIESI